MLEEEGFIRAILASPRDLALRLVYAHWLEERGDSRGEYLRRLVALDNQADENQAAEARLRLQTLQQTIELRWIALMNRGRTTNRSRATDNMGRTRTRGRRNRRTAQEADVGLFLRQYARKAQKKMDPNDRSYSREVEDLVKRMKPEDLDRLMRGEE